MTFKFGCCCIFLVFYCVYLNFGETALSGTKFNEIEFRNNVSKILRSDYVINGQVVENPRKLLHDKVEEYAEDGHRIRRSRLLKRHKRNKKYKRILMKLIEKGLITNEDKKNIV